MTILKQPDLVQEYKFALERYLTDGGEAALSMAYEIGRRALGEGVSLLEVIVFHHDALETVGARVKITNGQRLERAAEFLSEALSPFEMALRGYRDANSQLQELNASLEQRNAELRAAKASADEANKELEAFSYSVAHDLRAPLRSINGFSQALVESQAERLDDEGKQYLRLVRDAAERMGRLIEDLLRLSRLTRTAFYRAPVDLSQSARTVAGRLQAQNAGRKVELVIAEGMQVDGDPHLLEVALENLLGNAWKFTSKKSEARIEVGVLPDGGSCPTYFVRDDGAGFDMAYAEKLFGVFQRLHSPREFEGTGVGLVTVQRIVSRHGGRIWAEGTVGKGATFYFTLCCE